ncbi:MAG: SpoIID/LytB domain-containing protein [Candidatus Omnitrophota bacterium]
MTKKIPVQIIVVFVAGVVILCSSVFFFRPLSSGRSACMVRVRLAHDADSVKVSSQDRCNIYDIRTGALLRKNIRIEPGAEMSVSGNSIILGKDEFGPGPVRIEALRNGSISLNGVSYRGGLYAARAGEGLDVVNRVGLEDYLKGVLPREVNHLWPFAALKAQAVASRSFAVAAVIRRKGNDYDVTADTFSQVYGGRSAERWRTSKAVEMTRGMVLEYGGSVLPAYFHSCCGGCTGDIARIWGKAIAPLKGGKCPWCRWSPYFRWQVRVPTGEIIQKIGSRGYVIASIDDIRCGSRDASGRLEYVRVRSRNKWIEVDTEEFRSALGTRVIKSANFRVKKYPFFYLFSGYGWGHGVGMCQWGAFGLSIRRWNMERILGEYYPGAKIKDVGEVAGTVI